MQWLFVAMHNLLHSRSTAALDLRWSNNGMNWFEGIFFPPLLGEKKSLLRYLEIKLCMRLATHRTTTTTSSIVIEFFNFFCWDCTLVSRHFELYSHTPRRKVRKVQKVQVVKILPIHALTARSTNCAKVLIHFFFRLTSFNYWGYISEKWLNNFILESKKVLFQKW